MELKEARRNARYSQQKVADYLGVSRPTYAKLEKDAGLVTIEDAKKLATLFEVSVQDIFFTPDDS